MVLDKLAEYSATYAFCASVYVPPVTTVATVILLLLAHAPSACDVETTRLSVAAAKRVLLSQMTMLFPVPAVGALNLDESATHIFVVVGISAVNAWIAPCTILCFQIALATVAFFDMVTLLAAAVRDAVVVIEGPLDGHAPSDALVDKIVKGAEGVSLSHTSIVWFAAKPVIEATHSLAVVEVISAVSVVIATPSFTHDGPVPPLLVVVSLLVCVPETEPAMVQLLVADE